MRVPPSASASIEEKGSAELYNLGNQDSLTGMDMTEKSAKECLSAATEEVGSVTSSEKLNISQTSASIGSNWWLVTCSFNNSLTQISYVSPTHKYGYQALQKLHASGYFDNDQPLRDEVNAPPAVLRLRNI